MDRIAFIIPYFGKFNNYFNLWLNSCAHNSDLADFFIFTDIKLDNITKIPNNVKIIRITFNELKTKIQNLYDFEIALSTPYQLCDYKVAYGEIFSEYIKDYTHWAFGDNDVIWGKWSEMLPQLWSSYLKIGFRGHLTIFKNIDYVNRLYRYMDAYKIAFQEKQNTFFDEIALNDIFLENGIEILDLKIAECHPRKKKIILNDRVNDLNSGIFVYDNGHLYQIDNNSNGFIKSEYLYIHFLKRKMEVLGSGNENYFLIYDNIIDFDVVNDIPDSLFEKCRQDRINWKYWIKFMSIKILMSSLKMKIYNRRVLNPLMCKIKEIIKSPTQ